MVNVPLDGLLRASLRAQAASTSVLSFAGRKAVPFGSAGSMKLLPLLGKISRGCENGAKDDLPRTAVCDLSNIGDVTNVSTCRYRVPVALRTAGSKITLESFAGGI